MKQSTAPADAKDWIEQELEGCHFKDERLHKRFSRLLERLSAEPEGSLPIACQDWANTKAAYRFFSNARVSEADILGGHFQSTEERYRASEGPVLVLHDTTEFSYDRENIGLLGQPRMGKKKPDGRYRRHTVCGILMHSSLAITTDGIPLGLAAIKFWTRKHFKGTEALKRKINPTRVPIEQKESVRWLQNLRQSAALLGERDRCVHVGDREGDIYELFCVAAEEKTHFLVRTSVDRLALDGATTVLQEMEGASVRGLHQIEVRDKKGQVRKATLELTYRRLRVLPPVAKQADYPALMLTVIHAQERNVPKGCKGIDWKLLTDLPVRSRNDAIEKLDWYAMRWKIEVFHKILKSGCKVEEARLRTAERLANLIATFCILSWRIFWMTMINRSLKVASPALAFTTEEIRLLDQLIDDKVGRPKRRRTLSDYLTKIAQLGGYLARANDSPPGNTVMWRGMRRLTDIEFGYKLAVRNCG